ncbi:hypothetical protein IW140_005563 [Coemansia sp. RSA 1813]|nr:hypothetical protein EV178_005676 [Coemansia sp. RSA 1646]KAJ1767086.1 hypothetical protein LPJ74_005550 [Coemansia sp. RSA 1843]KAJ2086537.1 hypothetical protein IW138_005621 [Coemansia sp. RSA 986]KAJ2211880.1 hypothetical protein EV179_005114 [Coemansia sp. RSA 487]KAJ2564881.1 hypothetical protein IW140_005563 [Coemansia sp. RSA 1813]
MVCIISVASIAALLASSALSSPVANSGACAHPGHAHIARRGFGPSYGTGFVPGYGIGYGTGYGGGFGFGFPFASSFTNALNTNFNAANFNDDTLYVNNKDANTVNSNLNTFTNANTII